MPSLVLELQRDALDKSVATSDLLRKALVVARKLRVTDIEQWISNELNGYPEGVAVPDYRTLRGETKVHNPFHGWVPLIMSDAKQADALSKRGTSQAISELENIANGDGGPVYVRFSKQIEQSLMKGMDVPMEPAVILAKSQIHGLLNRVRNTVLEWALSLEERGITGEGMSFTAEERKQASAVTVNLHNLGSIVGTMQDSQIQQGTHSSNQTFNKSLDLEAVRRLIEEVRLRIPEAGLSPQDRNQVDSDIACIDTQLNAPKPKVDVIRECLRSTRTVIEGAAGSALFQGIITAIGALT